MPSLLYLVGFLRSRLTLTSALAGPAFVSAVILVTWGWLATSVLGPVAAFGMAAALAVPLFVTWLTFAREAGADVRSSTENLLTQLGIDGRGNRRLAIYDSATGLYNRWYLELRLQEEFLRCNRYGVSMAVVVIKLGSVALFDLSLDRWGRLASTLAHTMAQSVRAVDITAAIGPLEFAICLVHCDREGALKALDRVLEDLHGHPADVGLAVYPEEECDGKALIELARGRCAPITGASAAA